MQIKLLFTRGDLHLTLFRKWMLFEYGNSLLFLSTGRKKYWHMVMKRIQAKSSAMFQFCFLFLPLCAKQDKDKNYNIAILLLTILCCVYFIGNSKPDVRFWGKGPTVFMFLICLSFFKTDQGHDKWLRIHCPVNAQVRATNSQSDVRDLLLHWLTFFLFSSRAQILQLMVV